MIGANLENKTHNTGVSSINSASDFDRVVAYYRRLPALHKSNDLQKLRPCPLCGASSEKELLQIKDFQFYGDQFGENRATHRVVICDECDTLYTNPCYTQKGFEKLFEKAAMSYGHTEERSDEQCEWLLKRIPSCSSVLDFGCGDGAFLKSLPSTIRCIGVDANLDMQSTEESHIIYRSIDYTDPPEMPAVDLITMFHVLEHLTDPLATLSYLRENMSDGTQLVVEVPVIERAVAEQGQDIVGFFTVQHLTHFSKSSLETMLGQAGWEIYDSDNIVGYNGYRVLARAAQSRNVVISSKINIGNAVSEYLETWRGNVAKLRARLNSLTSEDVVVWGAGQHTEYLAHLTDLFGESQRYLIVDSDQLKCGTKMHSIPIVSLAEINEKLWREGDFVIVISSYGSQDSIREILLEKGVEPSRIIHLYDKTNRY